jgi:hypothetical protein
MINRQAFGIASLLAKPIGAPFVPAFGGVSRHPATRSTSYTLSALGSPDMVLASSRLHLPGGSAISVRSNDRSFTTLRGFGAAFSSTSGTTTSPLRQCSPSNQSAFDLTDELTIGNFSRMS